MASFAAAPDQNVPLEGVNREEEEDNRTQLEKDIASNAGVIPIYPWIENGKPKDNIPPRTYARDLLEAKTQNNQPGSIVQCNSDGCEGGIGKGMFWRSVETGENMVPTGWSNYGGPGQFTICALCKASDVENGFVYEELELGSVDDNSSQGGPGGTDGDKQSSTIPTVSQGASSPPQGSKRKRQPTLIERANELFKGKLSREDLEALEKKIREDINKDRLEAAERRREYNKKSKTGGKRRRKKRTKKMRKSRRRKRTRKRRKSRRRRR